MQLSSAPAKIVEPVCNTGDKNSIPVASNPTPGGASFADGFPVLTGTPVISGGIPPSRKDMNGVLFETSAPLWWMNAGAGFPYDSVFSAAVGGYPKGARVLNAAGTGYWLSVTDNNVTDPDTGGAGWVPTWRAAASVYASAQQTLASGNSKVLWDTVENDSQSLWNAGSQRFQAIWPGLYRVSGSIYLPAPDGQNLSAMVYKNGALAKQCSQFPQVSNVSLSYPFDAIILCAAGDYLETFMNVSGIAVLAGQVGSNQAYVFGQIEFLGT